VTCLVICLCISSFLTWQRFAYLVDLQHFIADTIDQQNDAPFVISPQTLLPSSVPLSTVFKKAMGLALSPCDTLLLRFVSSTMPPTLDALNSLIDDMRRENAAERAGVPHAPPSQRIG
jgi:hypothetical protein